jgi:hypothetical protein
LGILVMVALACSGGLAVARATTSVGGNAVNLVATPAVKAALRRAFCRHVTSGPCPRGPLKTAKLRTYYGRVGVNEYAVAYFDVMADQPEWFSRRVRGTWRDRGDTGGDLCGQIPRSLVVGVWHFRYSSSVQDPRTGRWSKCYAPP